MSAAAFELFTLKEQHILTLEQDHPARDFQGYGRTPPNPRWPGGARIAVNINLNVEAGAEHNVLLGDGGSEDMMTDAGYPSYPGVRSLMAESAFEFGPRVGIWRVLRILKQFDVRVSVFAVVQALQQYPQIAKALMDEGHEIVSHGWRWIDYHLMDEATEREHVRLAVEGLRAITGQAPVGFFYGRPSIHTRKLHVEAGGFTYDRDAVNDELPYWVEVSGKRHLVIPLSFETNDNRTEQNRGFGTSGDFADYMIDCFDLMYEEGAASPKLMSIGLHDRLIGRPGRAVGLVKVLQHMRSHKDVWFCTGRDIAEHWYAKHPHTLCAVGHNHRQSRKPMHRIEIAPEALALAKRRRGGRVQPFESIAPRKTALLVVDMQTGFVAPGGVAEIPAAREIVPNINRLAGALRSAGGTVVWVVSTYGAGAELEWPSFFNFLTTGELSERFRLAFDHGQPEHALWRELESEPSDTVFSKNRMTPFAEPTRALETLLRAKGIEMVLVVGTVTNICCETTARDAAMRNFKTVMISDANASRNDAEHNACLSTFLQAFGGVYSTDEAVALMEESVGLRTAS